MLSLTRSLPALVPLLLVAASSAAAVEFRVTTLSDGEDANPGDMTCATVDGDCTVRAALTEARSLPGSTVSMGAGVHVLTDGPVTVPRETTLRGLGRDVSTLDGNGAEQTLILEPDSVLERIEVRGGSTHAIRLTPFAAPPREWAATIRDCRVTYSTAGLLQPDGGFRVRILDSEFTGFLGPAIDVRNLVMERSLVEESDAGVVCHFICEISDSVLTHNRGDALVAYGGSGQPLLLRRSRVDFNQGTGVSARGNAALDDEGAHRVEDCVIRWNRGEERPLDHTAGGVLADRARVELIRTQVRHNTLGDVFAGKGVHVEMSDIGTLRDEFGLSRRAGTIEHSTVDDVLVGSLYARFATLGDFHAESASLDNTLLLNCGSVNETRTGSHSWSPTGCDIDGANNLQGSNPWVDLRTDPDTGFNSHVPRSGSPLLDAANPLAGDLLDMNGQPRSVDFEGDGLAISDIGAVEACADPDDDGVCSETDCAPADPDIWDQPAEVPLRVRMLGPSEVELSWAPVATADVYELARGSLEDLRATGTVSTECLGEVTGGRHVDDAAGSGSFYVLRASNVCGGSWGRGSDASERPSCR